MLVFYSVLSEVWAWENNINQTQRPGLKKKKKKVGGSASDEYLGAFFPYGNVAICNTNSSCFPDTRGSHHQPFLWGRTWTSSAVSLYSEILTICNFQGWKDDAPPKWLGNMEKRRAWGWTTLPGEVTSAEFHRHAGGCSPPAAARPSLAPLLWDTNIVSVTFHTNPRVRESVCLVIWLGRGMVVEVKGKHTGGPKTISLLPVGGPHCSLGLQTALSWILN